MKTIIHVWSAIGHTPLTNRGSSFCDELAKVVVECADPVEARSATLDLLRSVKHAAKAHFYMPDYPNQNTRSGWLVRSDAYKPQLA